MQTFGQEIEDVVATSMEDIPVPASAEGYDAMVTDEALSTQGQAKGIPVPSEDVSAQLEDSVIKLEYQRNDGERRHASARSTPSTCKPGRPRKEAIHVSDVAIEGVDDAPLAAKEIGEANQADGDADTGPAKRKRRPTAKKEASSVLDRDSDASGEALRATAEKKGAKATRGRVSSRAKPSAMGVLDADLTASLPDETRQLGNRLAPKGFKFVRQRNECRYQGWRKLHRCCGCRNNPRATRVSRLRCRRLSH